MRTDLQSHPKVVRILSAIRPHDVQTVTDKFHVIGGLHAVWGIFDAHSQDGVLRGYTPGLMDHVIGWDGFSEAMIKVDWLVFDGLETLSMPEFVEHNGKSAKRRAEDQKRKRNERNTSESHPETVQTFADKMRTECGLEKEKEKEVKTNPLTPLQGGESNKKKTPIQFKTFLENIRQAGEKQISDYKPIWEFSEKAGMHEDLIILCWDEFKRQHLPGGTNETRKQKDWRQHFRKCVEGNWYGLWAIGQDGG